MLPKAGLTAALLTLTALLPAQAQAPPSASKAPLPASAPVPQVYVFGDVKRPGIYSWKPGELVSDALSSASGPVPMADLSKVSVIRFDKIHKITVQAHVNFNDFVIHGKATGNPAIQAGDVVYFPDRKHPLPQTFDWQAQIKEIDSHL